MKKNMPKYFSFILVVFSTIFLNAQINNESKSKAVTSFAKLDQTQRWVNSFSNQDLVELPVGVKKTIGNVNYSIAITKATFSPEFTTLTVFCKVDIPQTDKDGNPVRLFFGAQDIKLSRDGGIVGDAKLVLLGDIDIPFNDKWQLTLNGGFDMATGVFQDLTYVTIDCDGFKKMKITGAIEFSREVILPIESTGLVDPNKTTISKTYYNGVVKQVPNRVKGNFVMEATDWNDVLVNVNITPFVLSSKRNGSNYDGNLQFNVNNAVLDLSDVSNQPVVVFPTYYTDNALLMPNPNTWRGVFIQTFDIGLPKEFKTKESAASNTRVHIGASNLIIDKFGVSGKFYADNVFPLDRGITSQEKSWAYSLDHIDIEIAANTFVKANLSGQILLPITKNLPPPTTTTTSSSTPQTNRAGLTYNGFISLNEQQLTVTTQDAISFDLWKAKAIILPNSSVNLQLIGGKFLPRAILSGSLTIKANKSDSDTTPESNSGKKAIDFNGITFTNLQLQTVSPLISVQSFGYSGTVGFSNFPVSIGNINVTIQNDAARLDFDLGLNLMESTGLSATARLGIKAKLFEEDYKQKWKYDGLDLTSIKIDADFSGFSMKANLILMENDPVYGDGFNADLLVNIKAAKIEVNSKAIFGRTTFRYWYFDASVKWAAVPAPFMINGFGGGAYYKMHRDPNIAIGNFSPSGLSYIPDDSMGLGLKALVYFHVGKEEVCDGEAGMEIAFNSSGGVNTLAIFGKGNVMAKLPGLKSIGALMNKVATNVASKASFMGVTNNSTQGSFSERFLPKAKAVIPTDLSANVGIQFATAIEFDFVNDAVHGTMDVYMNTPGNFISGLGPGGRAGWAVFHKDPEKWYLYIGKPDDPIGIRMGVAGISLQTHSYFMAGTQLPGSPPPPDRVAQILGVDAAQLNYMRNENELANGGGVAFGAGLDFDTGDMTFLIFYARFLAGIGFDIMMKDYGTARCSNTGGQVGMNGWYANGQAYAYLQGELGVRVKLLFVKLKIPIISAGAAVLLQAKLPNPSWFRGYIGGQLNILGGLIKGRFRFKMTIGEECIFENGSPLGGIKLITDVKPTANSTDVDVFAIPQATFSMKVGEPLVIPEDEGDKTYKVILEKFKVYDGTTEIPGVLTWSSMKDRAEFVSTDILPPHKPLKAVVEVSFQKLVGGVFQPMYDNGQLIKEHEERSFTTGGAPNHIPMTNIDYSYPIVDQKYFLEEEYNKGYIQLKRGQDYLFDGPIWTTDVKILETGQNNPLTTTFAYNTISNQVSYDLPNINQEKTYSFAIVSKNTTGVSNTGSTTTSTTVNTTDPNANNSGAGNNASNIQDNNINVITNNATNLSKDGEIQRIGYDFATSRYKNYTSKMNSISTQSYNFDVIFSDVISLDNNINSQEAFETVDLQGTAYSANLPLINASSTLQDLYFTADLNPFVYSNYPLGGTYQITNRDVTELGNPPAKALPINTFYLTSVLNNVNQNWTKQNFPFKYNLPLIYKQDWVNLNNQIVNDLVSGTITTSNPAYNLVGHNFMFMRYGFYDISVKYCLPGGKKVSDFVYKFKNLNNFR